MELGSVCAVIVPYSVHSDGRRLHVRFSIERSNSQKASLHPRVFHQLAERRFPANPPTVLFRELTSDRAVCFGSTLEWNGILRLCHCLQAGDRRPPVVLLPANPQSRGTLTYSEFLTEIAPRESSLAQFCFHALQGGQCLRCTPYAPKR